MINFYLENQTDWEIGVELGFFGMCAVFPTQRCTVFKKNPGTFFWGTVVYGREVRGMTNNTTSMS